MLPLLMALAAPPTHAATYARIHDVDSLFARADRVVRGKVVAMKSERADKRRIVTVVTIKVDETYHGRGGKTLDLRVPGGTMEGTTLTVSGAPRFKPGQEVVVFAEGDRVVGHGQGAFLVKDGTARRTLGNHIPGADMELDLRVAFGTPELANSCAKVKIDQGAREGWSLRTATGARLGRDDLSAWEVTLVKGNEYRIQTCGDGTASRSGVVLTDMGGRELARADGEGQDAELIFTPGQTGSYYIGMYADTFMDGAWRSATTVAISYR